MRALRTAWYFVILIIGLVLLVLALPYQSKFIRYLGPPFGEQVGIEMSLPFFGGEPILIDGIGMALLLAATIIFLIWQLRKQPSADCSRRRNIDFIVLLIAGAFFGATIYSGFINVGFAALRGSGRLILGSLAFVLVSGSVGRLAANWNFGDAINRFLEALWSFGKKQILSPSIWVFSLLIFAVQLLTANLAAHYVFERIPHIVDSIAQLFHAKIFVMGRLTVPSPPMPEFFELLHMINNGQWYSQFPPGHSFLLAIGVLVGAPWLINPLLASAAVVLIYLTGREMYDEITARVSAILMLLSPFVLFMAGEMMNHTSAMFFFTLFFFAFVKVFKTRRAAWSLLAGLAIGWLLCIRPYTAVALTLPPLIYGAVMVLKEPRPWRNAALLCMGGASLFIALLLTYNYLTNGSPFAFGYQTLWGSSVLPGFGHAAWGEPHTIEKGTVQTLDNLLGLQVFLFQWPVPSLIPLALFLLAGKWNRWDAILLASFLSLVVAYFLYWFQHWLYGPRFLFEATPALVFLTARGLKRVPEFVAKFSGRDAPAGLWYGRTGGVLIVCIVLGLATNLPGLVRDYRGYAHVNRRVLDTVERMRLDSAVVFTRSNYGSVFFANSPDLKSGVIYVRDLGEEKNRRLMALFPGYRFYTACEERVEPYGEEK
jgi:hypothetical protein